MRYFIYHHNNKRDSFTGMPKQMLAEWGEEENKIYLYHPRDKTFSMNADVLILRKAYLKVSWKRLMQLSLLNIS